MRYCGRAAFIAAALLFVLSGCGDQAAKDDAGSAGAGGNGAPKELVMGFVPSQESDTIAETAEPMAQFVSKEIGIPIKTFTSTNYVGLVEAMGSGKVDIGALAPLAYVLANDQNGAQVLLKTSRKGALTYHAMFITRADSGIKSIEDAKGKRMAYVDPSSASGYLYPAAYLKSKGYDPEKYFSQTKFAGSHDNAVKAVYNGDVDVAVVYDDARNIVEKTLPDVKEKVIKIGQTEEIPNDTISVRQGLDPALAEKIKAAFLKYAKTPEGQATLMAVYEIDGMAEATNADYDVVRRTAKEMGVELTKL